MAVVGIERLMHRIPEKGQKTTMESLRVKSTLLTHFVETLLEKHRMEPCFHGKLFQIRGEVAQEVD